MAGTIEPAAPSPQGSARLAELCGVISLASDVAIGQRLESGIRTARLAVTLADEYGLTTAERADVYYYSLLRMAGCTATPELADAVGDLRALGAAFDDAAADFGDRREAMPLMLRHVTHGRPVGRKVVNVAKMMTVRPATMREGHRSHCEVAQLLAARLDAGPVVLDALEFTYERWDGSGTPAGRCGEDIPIVARIGAAAYHMEMLLRKGGPTEAVEGLRHRAGRGLDPGIVDAAVRRVERLSDVVAVSPTFDDLLAAEPGSPRVVGADAVDAAAAVLGDFSEPFGWMRGHGRRVSALVETAAAGMRLGTSDAATARQAAALHDLGNVAVSVLTLDHDGPPSELGWDDIHLHPYQSERIAGRSRALRAAAKVAGAHHERPDGSGYHRQLSGGALPAAACLVAAADAYDAMVHDRPWRRALAPDAAATELEAMVDRGHLEGAAVAAVLSAAGHRASARPAAWPLGLTDREVDVLRSVARGLSIKQAARRDQPEDGRHPPPAHLPETGRVDEGGRHPQGRRTRPARRSRLIPG